MNTKLKLRKPSFLTVLYGAILFAFALGFVILTLKGKRYPAFGCLFWAGISTILFIARPASPLHRFPVVPSGIPEGQKGFALLKSTWKQILFSVLLCAVTVFTCILPMSLAPAWNGSFPEHRNQYEVLARSLQAGHIWLDYDDVDPILETLDNPYDPAARNDAGADYHSDHAYYNGKYYMYFGVVPAVLLFLPYLSVTGNDLTTYHATQIFVALAICGIFLLFRKLARRYFPTMSVVTLLSLSTAFSVISTYYAIDAPALYCTAITGAVCLEIWSLYFFVSAVYLADPAKEWGRVFLAILGGLLGALAFGCRPPAALGNLLLIPLLYDYVKGELSIRPKKSTGKLIFRIFLAAVPYLVIGVLLMLYNYARFENPFEFGQAYQLTANDQSGYGNLIERFSTVRSVNGLLDNFLGFTPITGVFPYVFFGSVFVNFPILAFLFVMLGDRVRLRAKQSGLYTFMIGLLVLPPLITLVQVQWTPGTGTAERYRMDIYYLLTLLCFLVIGFYHECLSVQQKRRFGCGVCYLCLYSVFLCLLLSLAPNDYNYTEWFPESLEHWRQILLLH